MSQDIQIIGGTYYEVCIEPEYFDLYGSGLRAAAALSSKGFSIKFTSCIADKDRRNAISACETFGIESSFHSIPETVTFYYYHPLSHPEFHLNITKFKEYEFQTIQASKILYYGLIEANIKVSGDYVVYDPQNQVSFKQTGSTANHLALILNKEEALILSNLVDKSDLNEVGRQLLDSENAEVVVIKNGSQGALVFDRSGVLHVPVFKTDSVWPIGSGDIFTAAFAWKWMMENEAPLESALLASQYTAGYCSTQSLPLPALPLQQKQINRSIENKQIYLAGPFFTMSERWLINEFRDSLKRFGNNVFSPSHDIGIVSKTSTLKQSQYIAQGDLHALTRSDLIVGILTGKDPGTLFEIGYAKALNKRVVLFCENYSSEDMIMFTGTGCEIYSDISTAVYAASW